MHALWWTEAKALISVSYALRSGVFGSSGYLLSSVCCSPTPSSQSSSDCAELLCLPRPREAWRQRVVQNDLLRPLGISQKDLATGLWPQLPPAPLFAHENVSCD